MIFGTDRGAPIANGPMPGQAVAVDGGFRLTGRWNFASGCHHAVWLAAVATVVEANQPRRLADGSIDARHFVIPASQARIEPSWVVAGLRGTGSDTFAVDDLFVPGERAVSVARDPCREDGPLYRYPMTLLFASGFAAVALGVAGSAIDDLIELAGAKRPRGLKGLLRDQALAQLQVGQAEAHRQAGRALLHQAVCDTWQRAVECRQVTVADRARLRLATTHAIRLADQAVDLVYAAAGASAIYAASPLQRRYQDMKVISQHIQGRVAYYESVGRFLLGLDPDPAWANV
jgi:alkylation response protein AidB-like acyl-CoA dehydrogenase